MPALRRQSDEVRLSEYIVIQPSVSQAVPESLFSLSFSLTFLANYFNYFVIKNKKRDEYFYKLELSLSSWYTTHWKAILIRLSFRGLFLLYSVSDDVESKSNEQWRARDSFLRSSREKF